MRKRTLLAALAGLPLVVTGLMPAPAATAAAPVQIILDGRTLALNPPATIVEERTLVPMRALLEAMGATLTWHQDTYTVEAEKGDKYVRLKIDRRLACLEQDCSTAATLDVPARLINDRTFVPARFISQALGFRVSWDNDRRAVVIETDKAPDYKFTNMTIPTLTAGQVITGPISLRAEGATGSGVQFILIDPATGSGPLIAAGADTAATYTYTPDPTVRGARLIVAAVKDASGAVRYSDPVPVTLAPNPVVGLTGIEPNGTITGPIQLGNDVNFVATYAEIQLVNAMNDVTSLGKVGPGDKLTWYPQVGHNGPMWIKAVAYDRYDNKYESKLVPVTVASGYRQGVSGVTDGATLTGPVTLSTSANYPIEGIKYVLDDQVMGWGYDYKWNITQALNGAHTLRIEVLDRAGTWRVIGPYNVTVKVTPRVWLSGVGPNQVVQGPVTFNAGSNVTVSGAKFYMTEPGGTTSLLGQAPSYAWTPPKDGTYTAWTTAVDPSGNTLTSDKVTFRVFLGKTYGPVPLTTKAEFKEMAMRLSVPSYRETGIAASLQVAQAFLETGYGQSVPVDKYTGQLSYNLFGIKGTGTAGSIVSNTWEVYNGVTFRVDANFRAYHSAEESWKDHKAILLERPWYAPFRAVMTDPVLGAWGLKRSGYATDPEYPFKLIRIMKDNDLYKLNNIEL